MDGVAGGDRAAEELKKKEDAKETTLKGSLGCPKCVFGIAKACGNAIKVKEGDKEVIYVFTDKGKAEKYHGKICTSDAAGSGCASTKRAMR